MLLIAAGYGENGSTAYGKDALSFSLEALTSIKKETKMKRLEVISLAVAAFILAIPMVSHAESAQQCASACVETCSGGGAQRDDDAYKNCLHKCLEGCKDKDSGIPDVPPPTPVERRQSESKSNEFIILAQNANYVACYKEADDLRMVRFRWCPVGSPWTPTNETRNFCYETSEACASAEMPQSWCIKCEGGNRN